MQQATWLVYRFVPAMQASILLDMVDAEHQPDALGKAHLAFGWDDRMLYVRKEGDEPESDEEVWQ